MDPELQALVDAGNLPLKAASVLEQLQPGSYCLHKSWGFGQVHSWNLLVNQIVIDFQTKQQHAMQLIYAAETLQPLPPTHLLVRKIVEGNLLRQLAQTDPSQILQIALDSFGGKITVDQLQKALAPEVVGEADFKKWWESTKKTLRKEGRFTIPAKKTEPITGRDQSISLADELLEVWRNSRQLKQQSVALEQIVKNAELFSATQVQGVVKQAEEIAERNSRLNSATAFEIVLSRDDLSQRIPDLVIGQVSVVRLMREHDPRLGEIIAQVASSKQKRVLTEYLHAFPEDWDNRLMKLLHVAGFRMVGDIARILVEHHRTEELHDLLHRLMRDHSISSDVLYWLCKERGNEHFADLLGPELMTAAFSALERDQLSEQRRSSKIHDLLLEDRELISDLMIHAPSSQARDLMRRMMMTPAFEELNKRSLMARMIKTHPDLQAMLTGESEEKQEALLVSWESLQKRKEEYDELIAKRIPENTKEISVARSYGDLRENAEYKAAKEMQTVLMRRKAELEQMLERARGTNFENVDVQQISIGTVVQLYESKTRAEVTYRILGAWDSDPDQNIISYQTAIGQALLGKKVGDEVKLPGEMGERELQITAIEPYAGKVLAAVSS